MFEVKNIADRWMAFNDLSLPVFVTNEENQFIFANWAVQEHYGYTPDEFIKLTLDDLAVGEKDLNEFKRKHKTKFGSVIDVDVQWTIKEIEGERYTISVIKNVTNNSTFGSIIENQKQQADNKLMKFLINNVDILLLVLDKDYNIANCSKGLLNLYKEKLKGYNIFELFEQNFDRDPRILRIRGLNDDNPVLNIENYRYKYQQDEEKERIIDLEAYYIGIDNNQQILIHIKDRTEVLAYQESIKKMGEFTEGRNRLVILGETMAGIAHEINNPLTSILLNAQMLSKKNNLPELNRISNDSLRISKIIKNLLNFSRQTPGAKSKINILNEIQEILPILGSGLRDINLKLKVPIEAEIFGDPVEFGQVILNILKNSIDALEYKLEKEIIVEAQIAEGIVKIHISDNGSGISSENMNKILDPFFTTKDIGKGTGLGLSTVFYIVEKMNGEIKVESKENIKTTFTISLPSFSFLQQTFEKDPTISFIGKKIIIIDDDDLNLEFLQEKFKEEEAIVFAENDPIRGMSLIFENEYDLLLLDADMPIISGIEMYQSLEENGYNVSKIILMYDPTHDHLRPTSLSEYKEKSITKPFTLYDLKMYLNEVGGDQHDFSR